MIAETTRLKVHFYKRRDDTKLKFNTDLATNTMAITLGVVENLQN